MWGTVLLLALLVMPDPVRIGIAVLLLSRPRPMLNLLVFWLGGVALCTVAGLGVLFALRDFAPVVIQGMASIAASSTVGHIKIFMGVLALSIAALIAVGFRARQPARVPIPGGDPSVPVLQPSTPTAFSRLWRRAQDALKGGSLWVAFVAGLGSAQPGNCLTAAAAILASRAAAGTQVSAVVVFTLVELALVEIPLVSYLAAPAKTHAVMLQVQNWMRARRRGILGVGIAVLGVYLMTTGMGSV
jgi:hypothetical protein